MAGPVMEGSAVHQPGMAAVGDPSCRRPSTNPTPSRRLHYGRPDVLRIAPEGNSRGLISTATTTRAGSGASATKNGRQSLTIASSLRPHAPHRRRGEDRDGECYVVDHIAGTLHRLGSNPQPKQNATFPRKLSETGLFSAVAPLTPGMGVLPYSTNAEPWADHAFADRLVAVPGELSTGCCATETSGRHRHNDDGDAPAKGDASA